MDTAAGGVALGAARDPDPELIGRKDRLSVLSFNMHHKDRPRDLALLADRLRSDVPETPDFILLQEVMFDRPARKGEDNTAEVLANELDYHCRGAQRTSDREGVAIISRYRFDYFDECHHKAQTNRLLLGFNRVSVMGEFHVPHIGRVRVVNVHFTNWGFEEHVRRQQLAETLRWTADRQAEVPADVIILGGDFNIEPDWDELEVMRDARSTCGIEYRDYNNPRTDTFGSVGDASKRVDYIFMAEPSKRVALKHLGEQALWANGLQRAGSGARVHLSDHLPLLQEYEVSGVTAGLAAAQ
jgi:endonuclease/exonuclease/phosphatase family metal-dependent hydrolase